MAAIIKAILEVIIKLFRQEIKQDIKANDADKVTDKVKRRWADRLRNHPGVRNDKGDISRFVR